MRIWFDFRMVWIRLSFEGLIREQGKGAGRFYEFGFIEA